MLTNNKAATTLRRLKGRERLTALANAPSAWETGNRELDRLRAYLIEWASRQVEITAARKETSESCLTQFMKSDSPTITELFSHSDDWAMGVIDAAIADLLKLKDGLEMHASLRVRYLNEGLTKEAGMRVRVFRSNRLQHLTLAEADALADRAESALVQSVKQKGLPL